MSFDSAQLTSFDCDVISFTSDFYCCSVSSESASGEGTIKSPTQTHMWAHAIELDAQLVKLLTLVIPSRKKDCDEYWQDAAVLTAKGCITAAATYLITLNHTVCSLTSQWADRCHPKLPIPLGNPGPHLIHGFFVNFAVINVRWWWWY